MRKNVLCEPRFGETVTDYIQFMAKVYRYTLGPVEGVYNGTPVFISGDSEADWARAYRDWCTLRVKDQEVSK